jgi:Dyp-type peroxidase family
VSKQDSKIESKTETLLEALQGNVVHGYGLKYVRHLLLQVATPVAARQWLNKATDTNDASVLKITSDAQWSQMKAAALASDAKTQAINTLNVAFTFGGLQALGLSKNQLDSFPKEFREGMHHRSNKIGDVGSSSPNCWPAPFNEPDNIHLVVSIHASDSEGLDKVQNQVVNESGEAFTIMGHRDGHNFAKGYVHFGYKDGISQPKFKGIADPKRHPDAQPEVPLGALLLGHETEYADVAWRVPDDIGQDGCFNAFRVLAQDVKGFEAFLDEKATQLEQHKDMLSLLPAETAYWKTERRYEALREVIAAKMCGRWRSGAPLELHPLSQPLDPSKEEQKTYSDFEYSEDGTRCPFGAHTRRANPRGGHIVQRMANNTRRIVRRGIPYGEKYDPSAPDDGAERGLLGNFMGANLGAQFEAIMCDWVNLGGQDPRITGSNDPLLGVNDADTSSFVIPLKNGTSIRLQGLPRFITCRGGAYTFIPSIPAIRKLSTMG